MAWSFRKESSAFALLYSSLGLIPLFMFWIYFLWVVVLYGLELTSLFQVVGKRLDGTMPRRAELPPLTDPAGVVPLVQIVARRFADGLTTTRDVIVEETQLSERAVDLMLHALTEKGLLHRLEDDDEQAFTLSRPPESIGTAELLRVAQALTADDESSADPAWSWVHKFHDAQLKLGIHKSLAEL